MSILSKAVGNGKRRLKSPAKNGHGDMAPVDGRPISLAALARLRAKQAPKAPRRRDWLDTNACKLLSESKWWYSYPYCVQWARGDQPQGSPARGWTLSMLWQLYNQDCYGARASQRRSSGSCGSSRRTGCIGPPCGRCRLPARFCPLPPRPPPSLRTQPVKPLYNATDGASG